MLRNVRLFAGAVVLLGAVDLVRPPEQALAKSSDQCNVAVTYAWCSVSGEETMHDFCSMICSTYSGAYMCPEFSPQVVCYGEPE
jgi:hypothetical protein